MVRRQRETGMKGLGQVLKSFRDRSNDFPVYDRNSGTDAFLHTLGPLEIPRQGSRAGLHVDVPTSEPGAGIQSQPIVHDIGATPILGKTSSG
jgi:deaminated glutathione amidase